MVVGDVAFMVARGNYPEDAVVVTVLVAGIAAVWAVGIAAVLAVGITAVLGRRLRWFWRGFVAWSGCCH